MEIFTYGAVFILGTLIGSFLNVVIYRLHTGKSLNGRSHCMSCGKILRWTELVPVLSYLVLRGRCTGCSSHIPSRYFFVELLTGLLFLLVFSLYGTDVVPLVLNLTLVSLLVVIIVYDMRHTIIPDELAFLVGVVAVGMVLRESVSTGMYTFIYHHLLAGIGAGFFFWGLWYISKGKWIGLGDAKLALPLAVIVGLGGVFSMVVLSFWIGAVVSLTLLGLGKLLKRGKTGLHFVSLPLTIKSEVPFAPFLVLGFLSVYFFHADIFDITRAVFFW